MAFVPCHVALVPLKKKKKSEGQMTLPLRWQNSHPGWDITKVCRNWAQSQRRSVGLCLVAPHVRSFLFNNQDKTIKFQSSPVITSSEKWQREGVCWYKKLKWNEIPLYGSALNTTLQPKQTKWWFSAGVSASLKLYQFAFVLDLMVQTASDCFSLSITLEPVFLT